MRNIIKFLLLSLIVLSSHAIEPVTKMQKINVVIPYPAGSGPDKVFRAIEAHAKKKNIEFVPVYKPGADGIIGAEYALNMPADGNTIMLTVISDIARDHPAKKFRVTDFANISAVCNSSIYIVANSQVAVNNISDLFGQIKKNPQSVSWGIISKNFETNLEWFANKAGYSKEEMLYTRFNAGFDISVSNIAGGFVDVAFYPASQIIPFIQDKRVKLLGTFRKGDIRPPGMPSNLESIESVFGEVSTLDGYGVFVSSKVNPSVQKYWVDFMNELKKDPEVVRTLEANYFKLYPNSQEALDDILKFNQKRKFRVGSGKELTERQQDVLVLIKDRGLSNQQISSELGIGESAVKLHVTNLLKIYNLKSRSQLSALA